MGTKETWYFDGTRFLKTRAVRLSAGLVEWFAVCRMPLDRTKAHTLVQLQRPVGILCVHAQRGLSHPQVFEQAEAAGNERLGQTSPRKPRKIKPGIDGASGAAIRLFTSARAFIVFPNPLVGMKRILHP